MQQDYQGQFMKPIIPEGKRYKKWKKKSRNKIFLYLPTIHDRDDPTNYKALHQIVNVYEHTMDDFEFNAKRIIRHLMENYGNTSLWGFTIGQTIRFRVHPDQEELFDLSLYRFLINYTMLVIPVECGAIDSLRNWQMWLPHHFSPDKWMARINQYIYQVRGLVNMRKICESICLSKYLLNLVVHYTGRCYGLSISNNEFIEVMKRSKDAYESITCTFDIPEGITPTEMESLTMARTKDLLKFIGEQLDLSISIYARNGLFNPTQFREYAVHITYKPHLDGSTVPYTYPTNIIMGIKDPRAYMVDAYGGRKAEITKLNVSDAGTLERALTMLMSPVRFVDINWECDSQHFRKRYISSRKDLEKLEGRVYLNEPDDDTYWIIDTTDVDLIGKTIYMKTPITCTHPLRDKGVICSACYGKILAPLNRDIHIGRAAAMDSADEIEQKLLSAKHALMTDTNLVEFDDIFDQYFTLGQGTISFNSEMVELSGTEDPDIDHLFFEFCPKEMGKNQDGESRHLDRSFQEIVIYDDRDESRIHIAEKNGATLYLSPEFNDNCFLDKFMFKEAKEIIQIPFAEILDNGECTVDILFEFTYKNNELASPLLELESIMFNCDTIQAFASYDECIDTLIPLFIQGGIHIPDYQTELLVSQLIVTPDGGHVDWSDPHPEYIFNSISKAIRCFDSPLTSILYRESGAQIGGDYGTYSKHGTSDYDPFIFTDKSIWT